jgi:molybdopterin converting factor small subunit
MADVRFILPYNKIAGVDRVKIHAENCRQLCEKIIEKYGEGMSFLLDEDGNVSQNITMFYNDRNIYTLQGSDTLLEEDAEIIIMPHFHMA